LDIAIRQLTREHLPDADRIFRLAFGTFLGLPEPASFMGDADLVTTRWLADPSAALGAYSDGELVGSNFAARWGSFAFFGPLTIRPDLWDRGIAKQLLEATMDLFERWGTRQMGLFTFPNSPKHLGLYQKFGFWPQFLTAVMAKTPEPGSAGGEDWLLYSQGSPAEQRRWLDESRELTGVVAAGLDLQSEIRAVQDQQTGETVLLRDNNALAAVAVCHIGKGSEAGSGAAYVKFGAARPGADASGRFDRLLSACEAVAAGRGATRVLAGVNTARHAAYRRMAERGFRTTFVGVALQRPNEPGHNRPDCFVIDDWR
jgi:GNAT superfamily N-acetyltransferase